ncbi:hypothetical protein GCM10007079_39310 [Nocardiopsis terrae]|uniref:Secreted protein n=1 Tax=Nocardiopsis terrae TaxID=372655 RepID=A0ABR9HE56_9ACTN|nr:hypothetical protein [Nocardiopsis terrae]MBE1457318.1 hypothetical protein [Nocardiopsis terrae]GHC91721.1 hypothetical protein GCM10007079_39310 [Nocardiopsis terrae]
MRKLAPRTRTLATLVVVCVLASACAFAATVLVRSPQQRAAEASPPPPSTLTAAGADAELREDARSPVPGADEEMDELFALPIHAYVFTTVEETTLRNAHEILVEECMRDLGFSFTRGEPQEVDPVSVAAFGPHHNYPGRWHVDAEYAAENGFSHPEELLAQDEDAEVGGRDPRIGHQGSTYDAAEAALWGFPEDTATPSGDPVPEWGCHGRAESEIDEGVRHIGVEQAKAGEVAVPMGQNSAATEVSNDSQVEAAADQRVLDAEGDWRECMADAGYPGEDPDTVGSGKETRVATDDTEAAVRNVECREESDLTQTYLDVLAQIQERGIAANEAALRERSEELERALERAVELTGG